jgi:hypothetical protein
LGGDGILDIIDYTIGRNHFTAPPFVNLDARLTKSFHVKDRLLIQAFIEYFNTFNRANPAQMQTAADGPIRFGTVIQALPGREGQIGIKFESRSFWRRWVAV